MNHRVRVAALCCIAWLTLCGAPGPCPAESAIDLLSGFDAQRIENVYPPQDETSAGELAKLIYRLQTIDDRVLRERAGEGANADLGDAIAVEGAIQKITRLKVPERLVEFIELSHLYLIDVGDDSSLIRVVTAALPAEAKPGDRVRGSGVVIETASADGVAERRIVAIATPRLSWFPAMAPRVGWRLLSDAGVDVSLLAEVASRDRRPLLAEDGDAFYSMLAAAATIQQRDDVPPPTPADPVMLLRDSRELGGEWLRMNLETVQVTRIAVIEPARQAQLGSDHFYQIDAVGDLGNTVIKMERLPGDPGEPAIFANRYPVSVVIRDLPEFLSQRIRAEEGGDAVVSNVKVMVGVDVFFYRLWSYSTDFMSQHGGLDQFGPLLVAARLSNREPTSDDPAGVNVIGWIAAIAVISAIVAVWFWNRRLSAQDLEVRQKRKARDAQQLQLP
jgi:hypothetical protein